MATWAGDIEDRILRMFSLDVRSLALFRVCLSLIIILDLYVRSWHLEEFYTDQGVLPISTTLQMQTKVSNSLWSFHLMSGSYFFNALLFLISGAFAFCLLAGWKTKTFTFLSWMMLTSLHNRFELNSNGGDLLLRVTLFWAMFLPLGKVFSIEAAQKQSLLVSKRVRNSHRHRITTLSCMAWLLQFASMYVFSYGLKYGNTWWEGTAVAAVLQHEQFLTRFGFFFRSLLFPADFFPDPTLHWNIFSRELGIAILKLFTWGTLYFEFLGPFLLIVPVNSDFFRLVGVIGFVSMHLSFGMCLELGFFMYIPCACAISFLPPLFWSLASKLWLQIQQISFSRRGNLHTVYCDINERNSPRNIWWHIFLSFGAFPKGLVFTTHFSEVAETQLHQSKLFFVITRTKNGQEWITDDMEAVRKLIFASPIYCCCLLPFLLLPLTRRTIFRVFFHLFASQKPQYLDFMSNNIAKGIKTLGDLISVVLWPKNKNKIRSPWKRRRKIVTTGFVILMCIYCLQWNVNAHFQQGQTQSLLFVSDYLRLDQWWGMFSPNPPLFYGWFVMPGRLANGKFVDLMPGSKTPMKVPSSEKPEIISAQYPTQRWRKYMMNLCEPNSEDALISFGKYLCKSWNKQYINPEYRLVDLEIHFYEVSLDPDFETPQSKGTKKKLLAYICD